MKKTTLLNIMLIIIIVVIACFYFINKDNKTYSIKDKNIFLYQNSKEISSDYKGIKLLEYDNTNKDYAQIYYICYDYTTEPSYYYTIEVTDEENNSLLLNEEKEQRFLGGVISSAKIKKISLKNKLYFSVFEKNIRTNKITNGVRQPIDLKTDLEDKLKIKEDNLKEGKLGDISFEYADDQDVYFGETLHAYSEKLVSENCTLPLKVQYGNYLFTEDHIGIECENNVNGLNLNDAFEKNALINSIFGQYGLSDVYGMSIINTEEEPITVTISFDEMIALCNGLEIEKDGVKYTKDSFEQYPDMAIVKEDEVELANGIKAMKELQSK